MLRCNLVRARRKLRQAYELDPANPAIIDNPGLLSGSNRFIERPAGRP
jgi:Flp pilus assembly protein TadD